MSTQDEQLRAAASRLRSHELSPEAIDFIAEILDEHEHVHEIVVGLTGTETHTDPSAEVSSSDVETVVLTNRRLLMLREESTDSLTFANVSSIIIGDGVSLTRITVYATGSTRVLQQVNAEDAHRFAAAAKDTLQLPVSIGTSDPESVSRSQAERELKELDALRDANLLTYAEWQEYRQSVLNSLGLKKSEPAPVRPEPKRKTIDSTVRNVVLIIFLVLAALLTGAILMLMANGNGDNAQPQPVPAPQVTETASPEVEDPQDPEPADAGPTTQDEETTAPEDEETEEPSSEPTVSPEPTPYGAEDEAEFQEAVQGYLDENNINTSFETNLSPELLRVGLEPYAGSDEPSAIDVSADIAILVNQGVEIIEDPTHDVEVIVPVEDSDSSIVVRFDRSTGQYTQTRE